jgi:hypothetical protein
MSTGELFAFALMMLAFPTLLGGLASFIDWALDKIGGHHGNR